jgi:L-fuconolactonase
VPELTFVLNHLGAPPAGPDQEAAAGLWASAIRSLAALPNVTCKLSGVPDNLTGPSDLRPFCEIALAAFGPGRLMFGSDWPVCTLVASYRDVVAVALDGLVARLGPSELDAVFARNAIAAYGLELTEAYRSGA